MQNMHSPLCQCWWDRLRVGPGLGGFSSFQFKLPYPAGRYYSGGDSDPDGLPARAGLGETLTQAVTVTVGPGTTQPGLRPGPGPGPACSAAASRISSQRLGVQVVTHHLTGTEAVMIHHVHWQAWVSLSNLPVNFWAARRRVIGRDSGQLHGPERRGPGPRSATWPGIVGSQTVNFSNASHGHGVESCELLPGLSGLSRRPARPPPGRWGLNDPTAWQGPQ